MDIAERIERRLAEARAALAVDARQAVRDAHAVTDWRAQVGKHPWAACGGATALGFLLVPRRRNTRDDATSDVQASVSPDQTREQGMLGAGAGLLRRCLDVAIVAAVEQAFARYSSNVPAKPQAVSTASPSPNGSAASLEATAESSAAPVSAALPNAETLVAALERPLSEATSLAKRAIANHPAESLAAAAAAGVILALLLKRR